MKIFVWERVDYVTTREHDEGGVLVIAESLERAREMIAEKTNPEYPCGALTELPDIQHFVSTVTETIILFPDAGCC